MFFVFHPFFPSFHKPQKFSIYLYLGFCSHSLMDFDPFLHLQCVPPHWLSITYTGLPNITRLWNCLPSLPCSNSLLREKTGFHSLSFHSIFALKQYKSASLDSIVLRHWCQNLNFLLDPSHRMCHRLVKLNASKVKLLSPTFKPSVSIPFFPSLFIYACLAQPTFEMS